MRALLIVNPHATSTNERRRDLLAHALAGELSLRVAHTASRGHAAHLAAAAADSGVDLVVVHGGDGTVNEVVNGLMYRGVRTDSPLLAVVPGGSTNVFARALGIDADPTVATEQILEALMARRTTLVSLGRANDRYFTFNAGLGLDAEAVHAVEKRRHTGSPISNFMHFRMTVSRYVRSDRSHPRLSLELPDRDRGRLPGVRLQRRPVDLLRSASGADKPRDLRQRRSRDLRDDQHERAGRAAGHGRAAAPAHPLDVVHAHRPRRRPAVGDRSVP